MTQRKTHLMVATPCYGGQVTSIYASSLLRLQHACRQRENTELDVKMLFGDALITRARQDMVAHFLTQEAFTHMIFIDADIGFGPEQVFRLLDLNADVAAGVYPTKKIDWKKVGDMAKAGKENLEAASLSYVIGFGKPDQVNFRNGFAKVQYAGTGFMMIKREVLLKMLERYKELKYTTQHMANDPLQGSPWRCAIFNCLLDDDKSTYLSEDFSFCKRWTDMGGEIWVDLKSRLTHQGTMSFNGDVSTQFPQMPS